MSWWRLIALIMGGVFNRARGSGWFGFCTSTTVTRITSMGCMAFMCGSVCSRPLLDPHMLPFIGPVAPWVWMSSIIFWVWASLMLWCVFAWDNYWSVTIGDRPPVVTDFPPVDYVMALSPFKRLQGRVWGLAALTLRMLVGLPCAIGLALLVGHPERLWAAGLMLTMGIPYYISGYVAPRKYVIFIPEFIVGMIWVEIFLLIAGR